MVTQAPTTPQPVCVIQSPTRPASRYFDLADAFADIARAKAKGGYLLVGVVGSRNRGALAEPRTFRDIKARVLDPSLATRRELAVVSKAIRAIHQRHGLPLAKVAIVSGGANGVDRLAEEFARKHKLPLIVFPAHWNRAADGGFDKLAGFARNSHIAQIVDELLALPRHETKADGTFVPSAKSGTMDTVTKARLNQVPVTIK